MNTLINKVQSVRKNVEFVRDVRFHAKLLKNALTDRGKNKINIGTEEYLNQALRGLLIIEDEIKNRAANNRTFIVEETFLYSINFARKKIIERLENIKKF